MATFRFQESLPNLDQIANKHYFEAESVARNRQVINEPTSSQQEANTSATAAASSHITTVTVHQGQPPGEKETKITVDVVVDFKGIKICDHNV